MYRISRARLGSLEILSYDMIICVVVRVSGRQVRRIGGSVFHPSVRNIPHYVPRGITVPALRAARCARKIFFYTCIAVHTSEMCRCIYSGHLVGSRAIWFTDRLWRVIAPRGVTTVRNFTVFPGFLRATSLPHPVVKHIRCCSSWELRRCKHCYVKSPKPFFLSRISKLFLCRHFFYFYYSSVQEKNNCRCLPTCI